MRLILDAVPMKREKTSNAKAFASLARGSDILIHEICRNFGFDNVIVLPFSLESLSQALGRRRRRRDLPQRFRKLWDETLPTSRYNPALPIR